jgi:hypothetical protein
MPEARSAKVAVSEPEASREMNSSVAEMGFREGMAGVPFGSSGGRRSEDELSFQVAQRVSRHRQVRFRLVQDDVHEQGVVGL